MQPSDRRHVSVLGFNALFFCYLINSRPLPSKHSGLQFLLPISVVEFAGALIANMRRYTNLGVKKRQYQGHTYQHTYQRATTPRKALAKL